MPRGGARKGAGRKPGIANTKTREIAEDALRGGISPLEVMLNTMRELAGKGEMQAASVVARDAAPYCHPRLASIEQTGPGGGPQQHHHVVEQRIVKSDGGKRGNDPG